MAQDKLTLEKIALKKKTLKELVLAGDKLTLEKIALKKKALEELVLAQNESSLEELALKEVILEELALEELAGEKLTPEELTSKTAFCGEGSPARIALLKHLLADDPVIYVDDVGKICLRQVSS